MFTYKQLVFIALLLNYPKTSYVMRFVCISQQFDHRRFVGHVNNIGKIKIMHWSGNLHTCVNIVIIYLASCTVHVP